MRYLFLLLVAVLAIFQSSFARASDIIELTPDNFDTVVGHNEAVLVEFFAPWCGHCKALAPEYELLASSFNNKQSLVKIAAVDADQHRKLADRFGIDGFPTIKYFPSSSLEAIDYNGGRTATDLADFINNKVGTNIKIKSSSSSVVDLSDSNFDDIVINSNKHVLVEFFAPWCGHCKQLAPIYDKVGNAFNNDDNVIVAKLDADKYGDLASKYDISGFPTIKFFSKDNKQQPIVYDQGRSLDDFVNFLNEKSNSERTSNGGYLPSAGCIDLLDDLANQFKSVDDDNQRQSILNELESLLSSSAYIKQHHNQQYSKWYSFTMKKILSSSMDYVSNEIARLDRMINGNSLNANDRNTFSKRKNIVAKFL